MDARNVATGSMLSADVCIIGAGPAGITLGLELIGTGARVLMLEGGGLELESDLMTLADGESVGRSYPPLFEARARAFGGTSHFWPPEKYMRSRPLDPIDFEQRDAVPFSGWPFDRREVEPYYERAHLVAGLGDPVYDVDALATPDSPKLPLDGGGRIHTAMLRFARTTSTFSDYLGSFEDASNVTLLHHANVVELVTTDGGATVSHVDVAGLWTSAFQVSAEVFILAAGGIENARLLLVSRSGHPSGLGNGHDNVGRFFMEHLHVQSGVITPTDSTLVERLGLYERHIVDGTMIVGVLAADPEAIHREGILNHAVYLKPALEETTSGTYRSMEVLAKAALTRTRPPEEQLGEHWKNVVRRPLEAAALAARKAAGRMGDAAVVQLTVQGEQAPNPRSRVTLSPIEGPLGFPRARLDWQLSDIDHRSIRGIQDLIGDELSRAGLGRLRDRYGDETPPAPIRVHWHHMGTTRMHDDPEFGVVDRDTRVHDVQNLYVAGSSVFPTSGYVNPTLTIVALAIRLADHLKRRLMIGGAR